MLILAEIILHAHFLRLLCQHRDVISARKSAYSERAQLVGDRSEC